jgi:hypothetical protein
VFVDIPAGSAKAGMFARGTFEISQKEVLTLPASAIVMKDGFAYVLQVGADNRVKQIKIQTGNRQGEQVELIDLDNIVDNAVNNPFVASGGAFLADGDLVAIAGKTVGSAKSISPSKSTSKAE